ncbi:hypothetical protein AMECASPLE_009420 [Ameca splendens]|uniref:Uncharacterized protein n=1 Tax=Ameca splendens TaxID=208324 RepID=A0ABV1A6J5_9TELE
MVGNFKSIRSLIASGQACGTFRTVIIYINEMSSQLWLKQQMPNAKHQGNNSYASQTGWRIFDQSAQIQFVILHKSNSRCTGRKSPAAVDIKENIIPSSHALHCYVCWL